MDRKKKEEEEESWLETTKIRMLRRLRGVSLRNLMRTRIEDTGRKLRVEIIAYVRDQGILMHDNIEKNCKIHEPSII